MKFNHKEVVEKSSNQFIDLSLKKSNKVSENNTICTKIIKANLSIKWQIW